MAWSNMLANRFGPATLATAASLVVCSGTLGQTRASDPEVTITKPPVLRTNNPRVDGPAPGQLRTTGELQITGGNQRPPSGELRPTAGEIRPVGGDLRITPPPAPLQSDASFNSRLRPRLPQYGLTGTSVEPGWNDGPWIDLPSSASRSSSAASAQADSTSSRAADAVSSRAAGRVVLGGGPSPSLAAPSPVSTGRVAQAAGAATSFARPAAETSGTRSSFFSQSSAWSAPAHPVAAQARRDVRPDVRMAVRLTAQHRYADAIETMRHGVYQDADSFSGEQALFAGDAAAEKQLRQALAVYKEPGDRFVTSSESGFMTAALSAVLGERDAAFAAINQAREDGESLPSGVSLFRVLNRGREAAPATAPTPVRP